MAPINLVSFGIESGMDFDSFRIRRFSKKGLSDLIRNRLNLIFYPYSALNERQITLLSQYYFLCCTSKEEVEQIGHIYFYHSPLTTLIFSGEAERWYTDFPKPIESALRSLSLYDWERTHKNSHNSRFWNSKDDWESLRLPDIPFVLKVRHSPLWFPQPIPDFSKLKTQPFTDRYTEEEFEEPENWFSLTKEETDRFNMFVQKTNLILSHLNTKENDWDFINIALGYFLKAFICSPDLDQMLWFITSFEALVGEHPKGVTGGVTKGLIRRLSIILNKDIGMDENGVRERFERIYDLRSCLVHGGRFEKQPHRNDIIDARLIARRVILWFLNALDLVQTAIGKGTIKNNDVKGHERILAEMDLYRQSKGVLALVLEQLMIGTVDNFFSHLYVASIDLNNTLKKGESIHIMGHTTNILLRLESIQVEHKEVNEAAAGQTIGVKVADRVRVGDRVFRVISGSS